MQSPEENQNIRCDNILLTSRGIAETSGKKVMIFVPAAEIERITFKYGRSDHRPIFSVLLGIILGIVGIVGVVEFIVATRGYRYEMGMMAFGLIGGSFIHEAFKERYFLEVQTSKGVRRLVLSKHAQKNDLETFCQSARTIYKYDIAETALSDAGHSEG